MKLRTGFVAVVAIVTVLAGGGAAGAGTSKSKTPVVRETWTEIEWTYNGQYVTSVSPVKRSTNTWYVNDWTNFSATYALTRNWNLACAAIAGYPNGASNYSTSPTSSC